MAAGKDTSVWTFLAFIPATLGTVLTIVATTTHNWLESFSERRTGIDTLGLWEICFSESYAAPADVQDSLGKRYSDCNWLLSYELRSLRSWRYPGWHIVVVSLMCLALSLQLLALIFQVVYLLKGCVLRQQHTALLCGGISNAAAGAMIAVASMLFGYFSGHDSFWLPNTDSYFLSWSYGLCVVGGLFALLAAMFQFIDYSRLHIHHRLKQRAETYAPSNYSRVPTR